MMRDLLRRRIVLDFNWAAILAFVVFWSFGLFGAPLAMSDSSVSYIFFALSVLVTMGILTVLLYFLLNPTLSEVYRDRVEVTGRDLLIVLSYFIILLAFSFDDLGRSLVSDEIVHVQNSQFHFRALTYALGLLFGEHIGNVSFKMILWILDVAGLGLLLIGLYYFRRLSWPKAIVVISVFVLIKLAAAFAGLGRSPHPPFRLFPLWVSGSLLSSTAFAYRLPQFAFLILFMWFVQRILSRSLPILQSWLFGLVVGTIPVLWHTGLIVEPSIWTACIWSMLLLVVVLQQCREKQPAIYWIRWFSLISIFSLMRQSAFVAFVPLGVFFVKWLYDNRHSVEFSSVFLIIAPIIVMVPFTARSIIIGTPASYNPSEVNYIAADTSGLQRVVFSLTSGIGPRVILNSVMIPWVVCFGFAFLPLNKQTVVSTGVIFLFFVAGYSIFYLIRPAMWGIGRYQAEYVVPFAVLGLANIVLLMSRLASFSKLFNPALLLLLLYFNGFSFINLPTYNASVDQRQKMSHPNYATVVLSHDFYNYEKAIEAVIKCGYSGKTYIVDDYNANFNTVVYGYTMKDFIRWRRLRNSIIVPWYDHNFPGQVTENHDIGIVLIGRVEDAERIISAFRLLGWKRWKDFHDEKYGSTIFGLIRG